MATADDPAEKKLSRRRFIKLAGGSLAVGTAAVALGAAATNLLKTGVEKAAASPNAKTSTTAIADTGTATAAASPLPLSARSSPSDSLSLGPAGILSEGSFSIFWITDTQFLSETNPAVFRMMNNWIVSNWARFNGKMVIHTGDIVQTGNIQQEWQNADEAMSILLANGIPYTWCAGNHDDWLQDDATSGWMGNQWARSLDPAVASKLVNSLPYARWVGDYHDAMNTAITFTANELNFLVINVEWNAQPDVLQWVGGILDDPAYANHHTIVAPHAYIDAFGSLDNPRWGYKLGDFITGLTKLLDAHSSNVFLTLNGHFATECGYNSPQPKNNRNELMFDRQDCTDAPGEPTGRGVDDPPENDADRVGGGTVTVLTFDTYNNQIRSSTYDIFPGKWRIPATEQYTVAMFPNLAPARRTVIAE